MRALFLLARLSVQRREGRMNKQVKNKTFRCGWCADGLHAKCIGAVKVERKDKQGGTYRKEWHCECEHLCSTD